MKRIVYLVVMLLLLAQFGNAQVLKFSTYQWEENPKHYSGTATDKEIPVITLKDKQATEFVYTKEFILEKYDFVHQIIVVNSAEGISNNNKIYIPSGINFVYQRARVISPAGKITVFSEKDIKEALNDETKTKYRYFALEGIELGSIIEHLYYLQQPVNYSGTRELMQGKAPRRNVEYDLISPENLIFKFKSYNGFPEFKRDTTISDYNVWGVKIESIPGVEEEEIAAYLPNLQQFIFKLDQNTFNGGRDLTSYGSVSTLIYKSFMAPLEKSLIKSVKKILESCNVYYSRDEADKVRTVEFYVKSHYPKLESSNDDLDDLASVIKNKVASEDGLTKLMCAIFNELGVDYQVVITSDRSKVRFDEDFESYNFLVAYMLYFPSLNKYLAPGEPFTMLGFVPPNYTHNYGLFIKRLNFNGVETAVGKVKYIEEVPYDKTFDNLNISMDFSTGMTTPTVILEREVGGYNAQNYQPYYNVFTDEDKKKVNESLIKTYFPHSEVKEVSVSNEGLEYFGVKPFLIHAKFSGEPFIEKAGEKYLLKLGDLIGPQQELYQKTMRKLPIENEFGRFYHRLITINIPDGYKAVNLKSLNMDVFYGSTDKRIESFKSSFTLAGNALTVDVVEYYTTLELPVSEFENYRKVINAAADFNKLTVILEKI